MKSKGLVKLVLILLLASGVIVLGTKAIVSAQGRLYGSRLYGGLGRSNGSVFEAYGAKVSLPAAGLYHSGSEMVAQYGGMGMYGGLRTQRPDVLTVQPRLTPTPSVSGTVKSTDGLTLVPTLFFMNKLESKISPPSINPATSKTSCDKVAFSPTTVWFK